MRRRVIIGGLAAQMSSVTVSKTFAQARLAVPSQYRFDLFPAAPRTSLQDVFVLGDLVYYLAYDRNTAKQVTCTLGCVDASGQRLWSRPLSFLPIAFGMRAADRFVFQRLSMNDNLEEAERGGSVVRRLTVPSGRRFDAFSDQTFARWNGKGTVEFFAIQDFGVTTTRYTDVMPDAEFVSLERASQGRFFVVDRQSANVLIVNSTDGSRTPLTPKSAMLSDLVGRNRKERTDVAGQYPGSVLNTVTVAACGGDAQGKLALLLSPYRWEEAPILEISESGATVREMHISLPGGPAKDARLSGFLTPMKIGYLRNKLAVIFGQGGVAVYS